MTGKNKDRIIRSLTRMRTNMTGKHKDRIIQVLDEDENEYDW